MKKLGIIGAGNFGFALMSYLDSKAQTPLELRLYDHREETVNYIAQNRFHPRHYPLVTLSSKVELVADLEKFLTGLDILVLAVVSTALEEVLAKIQNQIKNPLVIISVMKALDEDTGQVLTAIIEKKLADKPIKTAVLVGGTTGVDLTQEQYLGMTVAAQDLPLAEEMATVFSSDYLQVQSSDDLIGVQYASSFKNLISLTLGIIAGLGYSHGTQTHALSLLAAECEILAQSKGAKPETFSFASQCWGNDMVMSATGKTRNRYLGVLLGEGLSFAQACAKLEAENQTAESINTLKILPKIADLNNYPILQWLVSLSEGKANALQILNLLGRK